ncbi:MAG: hypothetical protein HYT73_01310 [Candidatus Aenigmarchaeota archaeon]|nr:hypothetical protein [Candidatus Aenigmarchaeota archaeon]
MKKGMELPINMIVIIALAVLILVIITAFTTSQFGGGVSSISQEAAFAQLCTQYRGGGCTTGWQNFRTNVQGAGSLTLQTICQNKFGTSSTEEICKQNCGCLTVGGGPSGGLPPIS